MNHTEAAKVLASLATAFNHELEETEAAVWYEAALQSVDYTLAGRAVRRIILEDKFWPTPARFNEMRRAVQADSEPPRRQLPAGPRTQAELDAVARLIEKCRDITAATAEKKHYHGGPEPCPVCGGINPSLDLKAKQKRRAKRGQPADQLLAIAGHRKTTYAPWNAQHLEPLNIVRKA